MRFEFDLGSGYSLALRTLATVETMHRLTEKNLDRLRAWEPWAQGEQSESDLAAFTQFQLDQFARGAVVPTVIFRGDQAVGSASSSWTLTYPRRSWGTGSTVTRRAKESSPARVPRSSSTPSVLVCAVWRSARPHITNAVAGSRNGSGSSVKEFSGKRYRSARTGSMWPSMVASADTAVHGCGHPLLVAASDGRG